MMEKPHLLQTLLYFLATDSSSVIHLSYILTNLSSSCLTPSPHLQKWVTRITSLMHSKDPAARWAAICIAYRMSFLSQSLLIDNAQSWVGIVFPALLKPEPIPILKASVRYLGLVLCTSGHNPEFQRQVATPMVPNMSSALLTIVEKHYDPDIQITSIRTLTQLIPLYPSLHKTLSQRLFALCHGIFSGSIHRTTDDLLNASADLYAVLHFPGGKVGGANLWRTCLDEILQFSWSAWLSLRTTFPTSIQSSHKAMSCFRLPDGNLPNHLSRADTTMINPLTATALNLDNLKCGVSTIAALLRAPTSRPIKVPIGYLVAFSWCLLASTLDDEEQTHFNPHVRIAETAVIPQIWMQACRLLSCVAQAAQDLLAPHTSKLIMVISSHLEKNSEPLQRHSFLRCAYHLLYFCPVVGAALGVNRLLKATISILSPLYLQQPRTETDSGVTSQSKAGKKRRRGYEADNVLSATNATIYATSEECDTLIAALDVMDQCMLHAELIPSTRSLANRVLLSILLSLPSVPSSSLSSNPSFHGEVIKKVRDMCVESMQGTSHAMSKGTDLVLRSFSSESLATRDQLHSRIDLLLHPRRPPYVRTLPFVESLSLSSAEESAEESTSRRLLGLTFGDGDVHLVASDPQNHPEALNQSSLIVNRLGSPKPLQNPPLPTSVELHPQTASDDFPMSGTDPVPPLPTTLVPARLPPSTSQKAPAPIPCIVPIAVDDSDREEVPTIDVGSDSDSDSDSDA